MKEETNKTLMEPNCEFFIIFYFSVISLTRSKIVIETRTNWTFWEVKMGGMSRLITPISPLTTFTLGEAAHLYSYTGEKITGSIADTCTKGGHTKAGQ